MLRKSDLNKYKDNIYVLVHVDEENDSHELLGWIYCKDGTIDKYHSLIKNYKNPNDKGDMIWQVPNEDLRPMYELSGKKPFKDIIESNVNRLKGGDNPLQRLKKRASNESKKK